MIVATIPIWLLLAWYAHEVHKSPWGAEFGSGAMPPPSWYVDAQLVGFLSVVVGIYLLTSDFVRWIIKRPHVATR
jgi:hypothetical protein